MRINIIFTGLLGLTTAMIALGAGAGGAQATPGCQRHPDYAQPGYVWKCNHWERVQASGPACTTPLDPRRGYIWKCDHWERARAGGPEIRDHRGGNGPIVHDHRS